MIGRESYPFAFAGQTYQGIPALFAALIATGNDEQSKVSHLRDKAIKIALLDELAKQPFTYFDSDKSSNAFFVLLGSQQKTGRFSNQTVSHLEAQVYWILKIGASSIHRSPDFKAKFNAEAPLSLAREKAKFIEKRLLTIESILYVERALRYMEAGSYARAVLDLELAKLSVTAYLRKKDLQQAKIDFLALLPEMHALSQKCDFKLGYYENAVWQSDALAEKNNLNTPAKKFYAALSALLCHPDKKPRYNPIQLLSEVLADPEFNAIAFESEHTFLLASMDNPVFQQRLNACDDPNDPGLLIGLKNILPRRNNIVPEAPAPVQNTFADLLQNTLNNIAAQKAASLACVTAYAEKQAAQEDVSAYANQINDVIAFLLTQSMTREELIHCFFCVDPAMRVYPALCEAIQAQFKRHDPAFREVFETCLKNAANPALTNAQKAEWYWIAIRLCAANSGKQDIKTLLSSNDCVAKMFRGEAVFPDVPVIPRTTVVLYFKTETNQKVLQEKHDAAVSTSGIFGRAFVGGLPPARVVLPTPKPY